MNDKYIYEGEEEQLVFGPLPPGDYEFRVSDCGIPYMRNDKWVLPVKLYIEPSGTIVFANPWQGSTREGKKRDHIAEFLSAVNLLPEKGHEPKWSKVIGARGRCRLKIETAQAGALVGKEVNKVAFFHRPHQLQGEVLERPSGSGRSRSNTTGAKAISALPSDLDQEPDDLPF